MKQSMTAGGRKVPTGSINKTGTDVGWTKVNGKHHAEGNNPSNTEDGIDQFSFNVGFIDVRFMCRNGKGFNVDRGLKQFIAESRATDKDFFLIPLGGQANNL
jgi:hypothetical protein